MVNSPWAWKVFMKHNSSLYSSSHLSLALVFNLIPSQGKSQKSSQKQVAKIINISDVALTLAMETEVSIWWSFYMTTDLTKIILNVIGPLNNTYYQPASLARQWTLESFENTQTDLASVWETGWWQDSLVIVKVKNRS